VSGQHVGSRASELLDGRLTAAAELEVRAHLGRCAACAAVVHREQQVRATLRAAACQVPAPRGDLMAGLMALAATSDPTLQQSSYAGQHQVPDAVTGSVPQPSFVPTGTLGQGRRPGARPSVLTAAVLGSVSLTAAGAIGVGVVSQGALAGVVSPVREPSAVSGALPGGALSSTTSFVQPAVAVLRGAATTSSHTGIRVVDAGAASRP
jgi:anti-sigma factor RsiW